MRRQEHVTRIIQFLWQHVGYELTPQSEAAFVLTLFALLNDAIEDEVCSRSAYRLVQTVFLN